MKFAALFVLLSLSTLAAHAQLTTGSLNGSGPTRRPGSPFAPNAPGARAVPVAPIAPGLQAVPVAPGASNQPAMPPPSNSVTANGILLEAGWDKRVTGPGRAANRDMADLRACLAAYGKPAADLALHPDAEVFPGVPYLSPLKTVEAALSKQFGGSPGLASEFTIATEGFPLGLRFRRYDRGSLKIGDNTHFYLLVDGSYRVIGTVFTGRNAPPFVPQPFPPFVPVASGLQLSDLIDKTGGGSRASVADARSRGKFVVVYLAGKRNLTWYVPQPLINLILYCSQL